MTRLDLAMLTIGWASIAAGTTVAVLIFRDAAHEWRRIIAALRGDPVPPRASDASPTARHRSRRPVIEADDRQPASVVKRREGRGA